MSKNIVITGGTRGIGFNLAKHFLEHDYKVVISGTSDSSVTKAVSIINSPNLYAFVCDVSQYKLVEELLHKAVETLGSVDIWINNAGIDQKRLLYKDIDYLSYKKVIDVNLIGMMNGSKIAYQYMLNNDSGFIYNMEGYGSNNAIIDKMTVYGTSKSAVTYFTKSLANEARNTNVKVGRLSPGMVMTDFLKNGVDDSKESDRTKKVYNILADRPETVTAFLVKKIISNNRNNSHIMWLTNIKAFSRFMTAFRFKNRFYKI